MHPTCTECGSSALDSFLTCDDCGAHVFPTSPTPTASRDSTVETLARVIRSAAQRNMHKGPWSDLSPTFLLAKLLEESGELAQAILRRDDHERIFEEVGDVGWVLGMLLDRVTNGGV